MADAVGRLGLLPGRDLEPLARWGVPAALVCFIAVLVAISLAVSHAEQDRIVAAATADVEMTATLIAEQIDAQMQAAPDGTPAAALASAVPHHVLDRGQVVLLTDADGNVVASYPKQDASGAIVDHLGASQPLTALAEKAGVLRLTLPSGTEALATVHSLRQPLGQVTVLHPMADVLSDWRAGVYRTIVLIATIAAVLTALAFAYVMQATKARQADSSCRIMRDRVDMVLSRGRCGLWDWDLGRGTIAWSLSMFEILGMMPRNKALSFAEIKALINPEDGGLETMVRTLSSGAQGAVDQTFRMRNADGAWVWLRAKAELVQGEGGPHLVGIAIDVTEAMALEERSAEADMRLRDAIETISEAFVVWDADNRMVMCNSKFQRFHNLPGDAVAVGTPYKAVMEGGTPHLIQTEVPVGEPHPEGARTFEAKLADGRWLQINERRTKDGGYVSVGTDITVLKRNQEDLINSETRLTRSVQELNVSRQILETQKQRLAELAEQHLIQKAEAEAANRAKSDFLANMGHELRTPLNAILGFSEIMMLESFGALGSRHYTGYCKDIHAAGQYLLGVIADVLEMAHLEAGRVRLEKEDFAVGLAIQAALASVGETADAAAVSIEIEADGDTMLLADPTAVEKILTILLNNAVKYTPAKGTVTLRARTTATTLDFFVEDTGVGIPPDAIARLGRPFEQSGQGLKNGMRGSGLGLAIARSLVDLHGGDLTISSEPGVGTVVLVQMPNRRNAPRARLQIAAGTPFPAGRSPRFSPQPSARSAAKVSRTA